MRSRATAVASARGSSGRTRTVPPSEASPPTAEATTGTPAASASSAIIGVPSLRPFARTRDGTTTAADLGLGKMMSTKKDFIGRVMAGREALGLLTVLRNRDGERLLGALEGGGGVPHLLIKDHERIAICEAFLSNGSTATNESEKHLEHWLSPAMNIVHKRMGSASLNDVQGIF